MDIIRLYIVSYHGDFFKEREILYKEILPDLRAWCESKQIQLLETDVRWGGFMSKQQLTDIQQLVQEAYFNGEMPFFINITCDSLGLVPIWGDESEVVIEDIHRRLGVTSGELGILYGAYKEDNHHSVFLVRNDLFLDELNSDAETHFVKKNLLTGRSLETCIKCLHKHPGHRIFNYCYDSVHQNSESNSAEINLTNAVFHEILRYIQSQIEKDHPSPTMTCNTFEQVKESHEVFMKASSIKVKGREPVIKQLEDYMHTGGNDVPLLLLGGAGSGKSSVLSKASFVFSQNGYLDKYKPSTSSEGWYIFYHFVGAVPGSTELLPMLCRLLREHKVISESTMPHDVDTAATMCCRALSTDAERPIIVIVDAVNQFDEESASQIMSWLPRKLAPNVRCIVSMINDSVQHKRLMARESKPQELHLVPLDFEARKQIVTDMLSKYNQSLTRDQMNCLLSKKASENPLWLSVACEELRVIQDNKELDRRIREMPEILLQLLEEVLDRLETSKGDMLVATLCLLEVSVSGLQEKELRSLLGARRQHTAPSPYEEKEEVESSEKDLGKEKERQEPIPEDQWLEIFRVLRPYLRPYGDSREGRLDFYHRAFSKAVRSKYLKCGAENESTEESQDIYRFWHQQLADYFEHCSNIDRKAEEYLSHLCKIEDSYRLSQCLCDWDMLDRLYHDEYSSRLLNYWRKASGMDEMVRCYEEALSELSDREPKDDQIIALRYQLVARIYLQAGRYPECLEHAKTVIKWEEKELGNRPERMVELNSLMAEIYEEKLKLNDFVSPSQLPDLRKTINYARKSIELRKSFQGDHHKLRLGLSLMKLAFSLESWNACGGDPQEMTGEEAIKEGNEHIDKAIEIFHQMGDAGHYAEALMTKGVLAPRGSMEQLKFYNEAMEICGQVYGEESLLSSRLYINIGIVYEDNNDYVKAYEYFKKWAEVSEIVLGPDHPKTIRAKGVLREPRYRLVATRLKQNQDGNRENSEGITVDEDSINREVEDLDDEETFSGSNNEEEEVDLDIDNESDNRLREERGEENEREDRGQDNFHVMDASDFMQRILNEFWQRIGDDTIRPAGANSAGAEGGPVEIELPPSSSLLIRTNPLLQDNRESENSSFSSGDNRIDSLLNGGRMIENELNASDNRFNEEDNRTLEEAISRLLEDSDSPENEQDEDITQNDNRTTERDNVDSELDWGQSRVSTFFSSNSARRNMDDNG